MGFESAHADVEDMRRPFNRMVVNREEILLALYNRETFPEPENSVRKALGIKDKKAVNICVATSVAISFGNLMHEVLKKDKFASV